MIDENEKRESMGRSYVRMMVMDVIRVFGDELNEMRGVYNFMSDSEDGDGVMEWCLEKKRGFLEWKT